MKRGLLGLLMLILSAGSVYALEVNGVTLDPQVEVQGQSLALNGYGIRTKFFFDIYIGSLYSAHPLTRYEQALEDPSAKLIRMDFLYRKVDREKIVEAFAEGIRNNSPRIAESDEVRRFLSWFTRDFVRGDQVDLILRADGTVRATQNGVLLGEMTSADLARGVLGIYLGNTPADQRLKDGMLSGKQS